VSNAICWIKPQIRSAKKIAEPFPALAVSLQNLNTDNLDMRNF
jgi:hypothetical protein